MSDHNDGGPAFGQVVELRCVRVDPFGAEEWEPALAQGGMSMRDYFAAKAMRAMIAKSTGQDSIGGKAGVPLIARYAYEFADAMLVAREQS